MLKVLIVFVEMNTKVLALSIFRIPSSWRLLFSANRNLPLLLSLWVELTFRSIFESFRRCFMPGFSFLFFNYNFHRFYHNLIHTRVVKFATHFRLKCMVDLKNLEVEYF